jgi:hypothetical protein
MLVDFCNKRFCRRRRRSRSLYALKEEESSKELKMDAQGRIGSQDHLLLKRGLRKK